MTLPAASHAARRLWPWATAGTLCGALAMLVLQLPAHWLAPAVERATGERIRVADVRGTLWNGSAVLSLAAGPGSHDLRALPGRTHWRLRPSLSAVPALQLSIDQACCLDRSAQARIAIDSDGLDLQLGALDWRGPVEVMQGLGTPWNTLGFDGRLRVSTQALHLRRQQGQMQLEGRLSLTAESVSSRISALRPLGSYRFDIDGRAPGRDVKGDASDPLRLTLATLQGPLQLRGQGAWTAGQLRFRGEAQAESGREEALANVLNLIGNRNGAVALRVLR